MDALDKLEAMDDGAAAHFGFQARDLGIKPADYQDILPQLRLAYYLCGYIGIGVLLAAIVLLFLLHNRKRSALIAILSFAVAIALIEATRIFVPRRRPDDAVLWLGADARTGSYPCAAVLLFLLAMILLGNALWGTLQGRMPRAIYVVLAALLTILVCLIQLFLSLHYVTDIIGAMAAAALIGWLALRCLAGELARRGGADTASKLAG